MHEQDGTNPSGGWSVGLGPCVDDRLAVPITVFAYVWAFVVLAKATSRPPRRDVLILALSLFQCLLGFVYHAIVGAVEVAMLIRAVKVIQAIVIFWLFLLMAVDSPRKKWWSNVACILICLYFVALYLSILFVWRPSQALCTEPSWLLLSISWFLASIAVCATGLYLIRSGYRPNSDERATELSEAAVCPPERVREALQGTVVAVRIPSPAATADGVSMRHDKERRLLCLIFIEVVSAALTLTWDIVLMVAVSRHPARACEAVLAHLPPVDIFLYIVTRVVSMLVPHWVVFYVFFWVERSVYRPLNERWDVNLLGVEMRNITYGPSQQQLPIVLSNPQPTDPLANTPPAANQTDEFLRVIRVPQTDSHN
eukprot:Polyplicarium_translucidae@DN2625_c0_g1_i1.p1